MGFRPRVRALPSVASVPNEAALTRLAGALLLEQDDEWQLQRIYDAANV